MTFSYRFYIGVSVNETTGKPRPAPNIEVPAHLRKYMQGEGELFEQYFFRDDKPLFELYEIFRNFPEWETVDESNYDDVDWTREDHNFFEELLKWLGLECTSKSYHVFVYF